MDAKVLLFAAAALLTAAGGAAEIPVANTCDAGSLTVADTTALTGAGGVVANSLVLSAGGRLVFDPTRTPIRVNGDVSFAADARIALPAACRGCPRGRFTLLTFSGALAVKGVKKGTVGAAVEEVFDATGLVAPAVVKLLPAPDGVNRRLVLTVGDYEANAPLVKVMPLGDSITEGTLQYSFYARPNYRLSLMAKLEAAGFKAQALGYQATCNQNAAGLVAPVEHQMHASISGQMCRTMGGAGGWEDSVDVTLDIAGEPDFVTFKIGTNDLGGGGQTPQTAFDAWSNVVWKVLRARPNARVICTPIVNHVNSDKIAEYNGKIRDYLAKRNLASGDSGFPEGRVFAVDICETLSEDADFADNTHPSWVGHDKVSDVFMSAITNISAQTRGQDPLPVSYTTASGVEANVPDAYRRGYRRVGRIALSPDLKLANFAYSHFDASLAAVTYERVAYYMELKRRNTDLVDYHGHRRFVWVDMDAFGTRNWAAAQFPKAATQQRVVSNLHVFSNDTGIRNVPADRAGAVGFIEFWPWAYEASASGVADAPANLMNTDWNDRTSGSGGYGSFQIHRKFLSGESWNAGEVLMAFNRWNTTGVNEIGIGSFSQHVKTKGIDYTFTSGWAQADASAYEEMFIEIWALPAVREVAELGGVRVGDGHDYTNAVVSVVVQSINPKASGTRLVVTARTSSGETVSSQERPVTAAGEYAFAFGGLVPGAAYAFEVTATNDLPAVASSAETALIADLGHSAASGAWIRADASGAVNGAWAVAPVFEDGFAEVGSGDGLRFGIDRKADEGKFTVVESVVEFGTPVDAAELSALDLTGCQSALTPDDENWKAWDGRAWVVLAGRRADSGRWTVRAVRDYSGAAPRAAFGVRREGDAEFTWLRTSDGAHWIGCGGGANARRMSGIDYRCGGRFVSHVGDWHEATTASAPLASGTLQRPVRLYTNVTWPDVKDGTYFIDRNGYALTFPDPNARVTYGSENRVTVWLGNGLKIIVASATEKW